MFASWLGSRWDNFDLGMRWVGGQGDKTLASLTLKLDPNQEARPDSKQVCCVLQILLLLLLVLLLLLLLLLLILAGY